LAKPPLDVHPWRHRGAVLTVAATLALIFIGGLVTSTGSGLAVPDWPLSYGMIMPPMVGGVFYEHGHRMAAATVGLLTLVLALFTARDERRRGVRWLAWGALAAVVAQGILGGLTVLYLLPTPVSVIHACLAQTFFCLLITLAYTTSREWRTAVPAEDGGGLRGAALWAAGAVYLQLVLGALLRHTGAGLAIPDFPLAFGRLVPEFDRSGVLVHFLHRLGALLVAFLVGRMLWRSLRGGDPRFRRPAVLAFSLVLVQISLGAGTVLSRKAVLPTTAHVAVGAALLGLAWFLTLRAFRLLHPRGDLAPDRVALAHPA
jgi:cytochrome c oxidase assembly protein subunit 15